MTDYLPHRPPFVLVDRLLEAGENRFRTDFFLDPGHLLAEQGRFTEAGLLENIAQTCALGFGYLDSKSGTGARVGFIGAVNRVEVYEFPATGQAIETLVEVLYHMETIFLIRGTVFAGERKLLEGEMKIVLT